MSNKLEVDIQLLIDLKNKGLSCQKIENITGIDKSTVYKKLVETNVLFKNGNLKHEINHTYFDIINTEDKAYFLGLLYADGWVCKERNLIGIELQEGDCDILKTFKNCLSSTHNIVFRKKRKQSHFNKYTFIFYSLQLKSALINLGCLPNKSLILKFPTEKQVPNHLIHHFIRGYFDGDGCVSYSTNNGVKYINFSLVGTTDMVENIKKIILANCQVTDKKLLKPSKYSTSDTFSISFGGKKQVSSIREWLYKDATIYLQRKYDKMFSFNYVETIAYNKSLCNITNCNNVGFCEGMCQKHYDMRRRNPIKFSKELKVSALNG